MRNSVWRSTPSCLYIRILTPLPAVNTNPEPTSMPVRHMPLIGIPTCLRKVNERIIHAVNDKYPTAVINSTGCLPILIPAVGSKVDPSQYGGEPSHPETLHDPERDATTLPLIREAVRRDLPILAICRGIQELNVALGGTLHQRVHELPGRLNHRSPKGSPDGPYGPAHAVVLTPGGLLASLTAAAEVMVNSLHSQGIDRPAPKLRIEALAPDGQIEAVSLPGARFVVGVQWHPEHKVLENPFSSALFSAFARVCAASLAGAPHTVRAA